MAFPVANSMTWEDHFPSQGCFQFPHLKRRGCTLGFNIYMQPSNPDATQSIQICHQAFWYLNAAVSCRLHSSHSHPASGAEFAGIKSLLPNFLLLLTLTTLSSGLI